MSATGGLAFLGAALRSSPSTEGSELASTPTRTFAASAASLAGVEVIDSGEIPLPPAGGDALHPEGPIPGTDRRVRESLLTIATRVSDCVRSGSIPILFGGDATVLLGLLAGLHDGRSPPSRVGLVSLDGLARFQNASDSPGGDLSAMVLALAIGRGPLSLTHLARDRFPLVQETDVLLVGVRDGQPSEASALVQSRVTLLPPDRLQGVEGEAQFMGALGRLSHVTRDLVVHFDASVLDPRQFPVAVGTPSAGGLSFERLKKIGAQLATWDADGTIRVRAASVSGIDGRKDPGGVRMHELAGFIVRLLGRHPGVRA